jgi:hypothetical protein
MCARVRVRVRARGHRDGPRRRHRRAPTRTFPGDETPTPSYPHRPTPSSRPVRCRPELRTSPPQSRMKRPSGPDGLLDNGWPSRRLDSEARSRGSQDGVGPRTDPNALYLHGHVRAVRNSLGPRHLESRARSRGHRDWAPISFASHDEALCTRLIGRQNFELRTCPS